MNKLKHVINWVIWSVVALNAVLMILTHIPFCQEWIGQKVAYAIGQKLGTEVTIGRIDLGFLNRLIIDEVEIKDQQQNDMIRIGRMSVKMDFLPLAEGRIVISSAQLFSAHASLYRSDSISAPNFMFVIDSLASKDTTASAPFHLAVNSLIIRRSSVKYDQQDANQTPGIINPKHININGISVHVLLRALTNDSLSINVKRLTFNEKSGLDLRRLSFQLTRKDGNFDLTDFFLQLPRSSISIDHMTATSDLDRMKETLTYQGEITDVSITPTDLAFLSPKVAGLKSPISMRASLQGTANGLDINNFTFVSSDGNLTVDATGWIRQWDTHPEWDVNIAKVFVAAEMIEAVKQRETSIPDQLSRLGDITISGRVKGSHNGDIDLNASMESSSGNLLLNGNIEKHKHFLGHVTADRLQLGKILNDSNLGEVDAVFDLNGEPEDIHAKGQVSRFDFNGYSYQNITLDGNYHQGDIGGKLLVFDPNIEASLEGEIKRGNMFLLKLDGDIKHLSPKKLGWSNQWGDAQFNADIHADFTASTPNDANGRVDIRHFAMRDSTFNYQIQQLLLTSGYENDTHFFRFSGDMGKAELKGQFDWETLPQSFTNLLASRLPTFPGLPAMGNPTDNDFDISLHLDNSNWLKHLLHIDLTLDQPLNLHARINDKAHEVEMTGSMPEFSYNDSHYKSGVINISTPNDTLKCVLSAIRHSEDNRRLDMRVQAIAIDNNLSTSLFWDNQQQSNPMNGELNAQTTMYRNMKGNAEAHINILPSRITMGGTEWSIEPGGIVYDGEKVIADHIAAIHNTQHIIIDGIASENLSDSLIVDLNGVEVGYILELVDFTAVSFAGQATGKAYIKHAFEKPEALARLRVDNFLFENGRMGTLQAQAEWNREESRIDINAICNDGPTAKTYINGYVSPPNDNIDLNIKARGTYIDFLRTYSESFLSDVSGQAHGEVRLIGPLGEMDLLGKLVVDAHATVSALGTTYTLTKDTVKLIHNDILLKDVIAHDRYNNTAKLNGGIHHDNLSNLTFDLNVATDYLLAYDFPAESSDNTETLFYGTVFAMGEVDLRGRPGEVVINCNATPLPGTVFTFNAANPEAINDQSFITWKDAKQRKKSVQSTKERQVEEVSSDVPSDLHMNFLINTTPEATLRLLMDAKTKDYITLGGSGVIRASYYNKGAFQMFGTYTIEQGTYGITIQNIIKKNFSFQPGGTIVFGGAPFDANLNLQAVYTVNGVSLSDLNIGSSFSNNTVRVNCLMNILGQANSPRVEFDLDMPTVNSEEKQMIRSVITSEQEMNQQVLYLLGIGRFYTQGVNNANTQQQYDQTQLAMQSFLSGTLSTQINEVLSQVLKSNNWNFGANISTGNEGWHNAEYEGLVSGRMLNNRLLINGQFGYRDNATQATPSFIGDFDIRYLLHPNGNLALKMYNQTNDRYFTHSSLNTQGIGLIMKKDFDGLGDLFHHRKRRSTK